MGESGGSVVINIGSVYGSLDLNSKYYRGIYPQGGSDGLPRSPAYHASKGGLAALTREFAVLSGQWNIRVNTISPGVSKTPERPVISELIEQFCEATPLRRLGSQMISLRLSNSWNRMEHPL